MPDEIKKTFVRSFVAFLKKDILSQSMPADAQESAEVAVQCLQAAYDITETNPSNVAAAPELSATPGEGASGTSPLQVNAKDVDIFELFQSLYIERNPEAMQMADTIKNEGNRLMKLGKYNEALLQYNRAINIDPKNPIFYCNRAAAYIRLGENERAVTDCKSALVYNADYGKAYGRLGIAYSNLGKYEEAQLAYSKAIELEPENQDYRNNLEVAQNARNHTIPPNTIPQLSEGINAMLSNPAIRNLFSSAEIDLEQLQAMSQNPMVMNTIGQMFAGLQGGGVAPGGGGGGAVPPLPNDMLQLFQSFAIQLANSGNRNNGGDADQSGGQPQPPPST